ncbi:MAG TPA: hypothetical protein PKZ76_08805 [Xanthomonadaceae bacterium]|nr:hypothetical protein [Xanthomonadaceae bacterium]
MKTNRTPLRFAAMLGALVVGACAPQTRTPTTSPEAVEPDRGRLERLVERGLPPVIGADNSVLVESMLKARMGEPLSRRFHLDAAVDRSLSAGASSYSKDCDAYRSKDRQVQSGNCVVESGEEMGLGAYARLEIERNLASGNIVFISRPAVRDLHPDELKPVRMSDGEVLEKARAFLDGAFGVDLREVPMPPQDARTLPVSSLNIGIGNDARIDAVPPITVQKVAHLRRGFAVDGIVDRASGRSLPYLPGPGRAVVAMDAQGVVHAALADWQELRVDPRMSGRDAKSRNELVTEIAEDLASEQWTDLHSISVTLVIASDWRDTHGFVLPSVEVHVLPVPRDLSQAEQRALAGKGTAGLVRQYALVHRRQEHLDKR